MSKLFQLILRINLIFICPFELIIGLYKIKLLVLPEESPDHTLV